MVEKALRRAGLDLVGELPWGAHICIFYETAEDLVDTNVGYFEAGLADGEFCIWALSDPVTREDAINGLRPAIPDFDHHLAAGHIELINGYDWYLRGDDFDPQRITRGWHKKLADALAKGFAGLRVSGNAFWLEINKWKEFREYEEELDRTLDGHKLIVLCTYSLKASRAVDLLDVARCHQFSLARRNGRWEFLESPELSEAKKEIARLNTAIDVLSKPFPGHTKLTPRERVALALIIKGASSKEAARNLGISPRTVEFHRANVMRKLGARNIAELLGKVFGTG